MKRKLFTVMVMMIIGFILPLLSYAQNTEDPKTYEEYRTTIKKAYGIDIKTFKDGLKGGRADGKPITRYDLKQLLMGIDVEMEHTSNKMRALEIATDHLEEFPDYYTRLEKMEKEAEAEWKGKKGFKER